MEGWRSIHNIFQILTLIHAENLVHQVIRVHVRMSIGPDGFAESMIVSAKCITLWAHKPRVPGCLRVICRLTHASASLGWNYLIRDRRDFGSIVYVNDSHSFSGLKSVS